MKAWVFKINTRRGWEFDQYFRSRIRGPYEMGDQGWIKSASSLRYLREEVKRGDLFLCYETDRKQVVGLGRAASDGRDVGAPGATGRSSLIDLCPPGEAVRLKNLLFRHPDLDHILAFSPQRGRGTVQRIDPDEFARLRRLILRKNPEQAQALRRLFVRAVREPPRAHRPAAQSPRRASEPFGRRGLRATGRDAPVRKTATEDGHETISRWTGAGIARLGDHILTVAPREREDG